MPVPLPSPEHHAYYRSALRGPLRQVLERWHIEGRPTSEDAVRFAAQGARVSKFEPCLPEPVLAKLMADTVVDVDGARAAVTGRQ